MRETPTTIAYSLSALAALLALTSTGVAAQDILARVITSTAVTQQVAVPRQYCNTAPVVTQSAPSGAGAVMGALAGGAAGNAIGDGSGRALATMIGIVGGAMLGNNIEGPRSQVQNVQQCSTQTSYENRISHYDVVYEYADKRYSVQMQNDPGQYVRLQVNPVGALPPANSATPPQYQPPSSQYQQYQQPAPVYVQPRVYVQPPVYAPQPVYVQPMTYLVNPYYAAPRYYGPSPFGASFNLGYSRGGGHRHWR
jgi:uncharacterized protein YcfJ